MPRPSPTSSALALSLVALSVYGLVARLTSVVGVLVILRLMTGLFLFGAELSAVIAETRRSPTA